jgi:Ohr subfamily peroxiredoxin
MREAGVARDSIQEWLKRTNPKSRKEQFHEKEPTVTKIEKVLYTANTHTTGGRDGASHASDGRLDIKLSTPGSPGAGTNPEQLFAAGWSACFLSAIKIVAGKIKVALPAYPAIDAEVDLGTAHGVFGLAARLNVSLPGMEHHAAKDLVDRAHEVCPYSRATRGNINVAITVVTNVVAPQLINQPEEIHQ